MKDINPDCPNFFDKKDNNFKSFHSAMDSYFYNLHSNGIGRQAKALSKDDEKNFGIVE